MRSARYVLAGLALAVAAACGDGDGGTEARPGLTGNWAASSFAGRPEENLRLRLSEQAGTVAGTLTYTLCDAVSCVDQTDALGGTSDGGTTATQIAEPPEGEGESYLVRAVLRSDNELDVTIGGQSQVFLRGT
jgi:hypothetical protein